MSVARTDSSSRQPCRLLAFAVCLAAGFASAGTLTILETQTGTTPVNLGYNLGHFMPASNAADWFRYSGVNAARVFISPSDIEPTDDLSPVGDGVTSETGFFARRTLLRNNAAASTQTLSSTYVNWAVFSGNYNDTAGGNNRIQFSSALANLRDRGISVLANLTASPSRFPITNDGDWGGKWELWQHYYAQAFLLSRDHGVRDFSMFNEPNGWIGLTEADWLLRYRICSDAIQSAVVDMNSRYGKSLVPRVFAPNTANGAEKYNTSGADDATTDTWGADAVTHRHLRLDGTTSPDWMNLQVYNYQKYTTRQIAADGLSGFVTDYNELRGWIDADMPGEPALPIALTEFNVRTGASYDLTPATQDSPLDFAALGANCIALSESGAAELYLFKFGQTANSAAFYGIAKNGTHYVENASTGNNNYGGATQCAEVYRLFAKAAKGARPRYGINASAAASPGVNTGLWSMATHDPATNTWHVFLANRNTSPIPLEVDFSQLPVPAGNAVFVEEVSGKSSGGIVRMTSLGAGKLAEADMPAESVWLITVPGQTVVTSTQTAVADTQLGDGTSKNTGGGSLTNLRVRADGTVNGRKACLIKIPVPENGSPNLHSILLTLHAATSAGTDPVRAHVYGVVDNSWQEASATWANATAVLKQNIGAGNAIANNCVAGQGAGTLMLGQIVVDSPTASARSLDVTEFAKSRSDGFASFLIVQDHRWDIAQPALTPGDTQPAGLIIQSRESATAPRLVALAVNTPPAVSEIPAQTIVAGWNTGALPFTLSDSETAASSLVVTATSSNPQLVPASNLLLQGSGAGRTLTVTPAAGESGTATITLSVSDGESTTSGTFLLTVTPYLPATPADFLTPRFSSVTTTSGVLFHRTTNYKGVATDLRVDIYQPTGDTATNRPVVMLIHGGGFRTTGVRTQSYIVNYANEFAKRGYVAMSIDYRQRSGADMPTAADELPALKDAAADALIALQWIRANGRTYRYDPSSIFMAGGSAGGRIATVLGCRETGDMGGLPTTDPFSTTSPASSISSDATAVYDRTGLIASAILWGGPEPEYRCYTVDSGDLPSVMVHGTYDTTLLTSGSVDLYRALSDAGVSAELKLLNGHEHSLVNTPQASVNASSQSAVWMAGYFVAEWQRKLAGSPLPPPVPTVARASGANLSLTAPFASSQVVAVQWRRDGLPLAGQTAPTLSLSGLTPADSGLYEVVISNPLGGWSSNVLSSLGFSNADLTSVTYDNGSNSYTHPIAMVVSAAHVTVSAGPVGPAPPLATNDSATTAFNTPVTIPVLANDSDPNGDALSITSVTQGARGAVTLNGSATVTYTPTAGYSGTDSFTYTISDGNGGTATATVNLIVNAAINESSITVTREATVSSGTPDADVNEATADYLMIKYHEPLTASRKAYFQFDVGGLAVDASGSATFTLLFTNSSRQKVRLWALNQTYAGFSSTVTWNSAQANETTSNSVLTSGAFTATPIGSGALIPLSGSTPVAFTIPNIGSHIHNGRITLVLTGEPDALNNSAGLRCSRNAATLSLPLAPVLPATRWRQSKFGAESANESVAGFAADPDRDGIPNLMEYALGGNPLLADTGILPTIHLTNNQSEFVFTRNPAQTDLRMTVQAADGLNGPWTDAAVSAAGAAFVALIPSVSQSEDTGAPERTVTIIENMLRQKRFMRLRVEWMNP